MALINGIYSKLSGNSPDHVHPVVKNQRMKICKGCPKLVFKTNCLVCGCFVNLKTDYKAESCPLGKWKKVN